MALFKAIMPQFIEEGRLCWLRAPLYKVIKGKQTYYFYNDEELAKNNIKGDQTRFKGLR
jgi:DNA gyrase/topoisomerase IV subunit B